MLVNSPCHFPWRGTGINWHMMSPDMFKISSCDPVFFNLTCQVPAFSTTVKSRNKLKRRLHQFVCSLITLSVYFLPLSFCARTWLPLWLQQRLNSDFTQAGLSTAFNTPWCWLLYVLPSNIPPFAHRLHSGCYWAGIALMPKETLFPTLSFAFCRTKPFLLSFSLHVYRRKQGQASIWHPEKTSLRPPSSCCRLCIRCLNRTGTVNEEGK